MKQKKDNRGEPRKPRAYKIADNPYFKAMKRATKEKSPLATQIEQWVTAYSEGREIKIKN